MKTRLVTALLLFFTTMLQAQSRSTNSTDYQTALGLKVWQGGGITLKHFIASNRAVEGIGSFYSRGFRLTGLYEIHGDLSGAPGLRWYVGPGAHLGFYNDKYYDKNKVVLGIDGVLGLDYKFNTAPINFSLDWQPSFEFADDLGFDEAWGGLSIRYTF